MRVISGTYKGRQFHPPKGFQSRPTTDFAKESLFNLLQHKIDIDGTDVLDLFSGTGSISYEFASHKAASIISVDMTSWSRKFINQTSREFGIENHRVLQFDVFKFIKKTPETFDIIFADPPFKLRGLETLPDRILEGNLLRPEGLFILEHGPEHTFENHQNLIDFKKYGHVHFSIFAHSN